MPGKTIHFIGDGLLESLRKCYSQNHGHDTDGRCGNGKTNNKPGKGMLTVKRDTPGNKPGKIQSEIFNTQK